MLNEAATLLPPSVSGQGCCRLGGAITYREWDGDGVGGKGHVLPSPAYFAPLHSGPAQS